MGKSLGAVCLALSLLAGCCQQPGLFQKVQQSLGTVQSYYTPLLQEEWQNNDQLRRAVVAADTALMVAGELQRQWCPDPGQTEQLQLQAQEAKALAQEAGLKAAGASGK
ncbi:MAG: hypothetical protein AB1424_05870 [Thermodesulfobacteriota bacterium]